MVSALSFSPYRITNGQVIFNEVWIPFQLQAEAFHTLLKPLALQRGRILSLCTAAKCTLCLNAVNDSSSAVLPAGWVPAVHRTAFPFTSLGFSFRISLCFMPAFCFAVYISLGTQCSSLLNAGTQWVCARSGLPARSSCSIKPSPPRAGSREGSVLWGLHALKPCHPHSHAFVPRAMITVPVL